MQFSWGYSKAKVYDRPNHPSISEFRNQQLCHMFFTRHGGISSQIKMVNPIMKKLEALAVHRIKANLELYNGDTAFKSDFHVDWKNPYTKKGCKNMTVGIYYVNGNNGYTVPNGILECREAVSRKIKNLYNVNISPERIFIMPGGKPTMFYAITIFGEPGAEIIYPDPGFPIYESMINYTGSTPVPYDLTKDKDLKFNAEEILSLITDKTRLLILINPNNPTGSFVEKPEIDKLAQGLEKHPHVTILSDEIYSRQIFDGKEMPTFFNYQKLRERLIAVSYTHLTLPTKRIV